MNLKLRPAPLAWIDGRPVWPFLGAEGEGTGGDATGAQGGTGGAGSTQSGGTSDGGTSTTEGEGAQSGTSTATDDKVDRSEFERIKNQLSAADKAREAAERKAKEYEDKDKGELEKATERATQLESERDALKTEVQSLKLEKAMLSDPNYGADKWHDVDDVLTRLNRAVKDGSVTVGEDGSVSGVPNFLKKLATDKKYLLKTAGSSAGPSGDAANRDRRSGGADEDEKTKAARRKKLEEQYPSIRR